MEYYTLLIKRKKEGRKTDIMDKFRKAMIENRIKKKLTKSDLARKVNKSPSFICDIEACRKKPSLDTAVAISQALDISMDKIFN